MGVRLISRFDWMPSTIIVRSWSSVWNSTGPPASGLRSWDSAVLEQRRHHAVLASVESAPIAIASNPRPGSAITPASAAACGRTHGSSRLCPRRKTPRQSATANEHVRSAHCRAREEGILMHQSGNPAV
jgi:hypothetical protein